MRTLNEVKDHLSSFKNVFGFDPASIEQGSDEWHQMKLGVISASNAHRLIGTKDAFNKYVNELVAEVTTKERPELSAKQLEWGKMNELAARSAFEFATGISIEEIPFIFWKKNMRVGCSPDGYGQAGMEIKCPWNSGVFVDFFCDGIIKKEYLIQCQHSMLVTDAPFWYFANYDPRQTVRQFHWVKIERDEKIIARLEEAIEKAIYETDLKLAKLGVSFGHQWS